MKSVEQAITEELSKQQPLRIPDLVQRTGIRTSSIQTRLRTMVMQDKIEHGEGGYRFTRPNAVNQLLRSKPMRLEALS